MKGWTSKIYLRDIGDIPLSEIETIFGKLGAAVGRTIVKRIPGAQLLITFDSECKRNEVVPKLKTLFC